jgi:hypothetical protein
MTSNHNSKRDTSPRYTTERAADGRRWAVIDSRGRTPVTRHMCVYARRGDADNLAAHLNATQPQEAT